MKKIISIGIAIMFFSFLGCEKMLDDALDREDDSRETLEGVLNDVDKVRGLFATAFGAFPGDRLEIYFWTSYESLTDNAHNPQGPGQSMERWRTGQLSPESPVLWAVKTASNSWVSFNNGGVWARWWTGVRACNIFLENLPNVTVSLDQLPQSERDLMRDEVLVLRAYYHMWLIGMFGSLPFMDFVPAADWNGWKDLTRPTYHEIANRIADELQTVIDRGIIPMKRDPLNTDMLDFRLQEETLRHVVLQDEVGNHDLPAYREFGIEEVWWTIMLISDVVNVFSDLRVGQVLFVPSRNDLWTVLTSRARL